MEIGGIAHIQLTVNNLKECMPFYETLLNFFGMKTVVKGSRGLYCIGGKTAVAVMRSFEEFRGETFQQNRIGLHHVCFRAKSKEDVDETYAFVKDTLKAKIVHAPEMGPWAPGYYSMLFEDPDGIRLEINYVPEKGWLGQAKSVGDMGIKLPLATFPGYEHYPTMDDE